jgi:hypothetical protein
LAKSQLGVEMSLLTRLIISHVLFAMLGMLFGWFLKSVWDSSFKDKEIEHGRVDKEL